MPSKEARYESTVLGCTHFGLNGSTSGSGYLVTSPILVAKEVAELLRVTSNTVYRMTRRGLIPHFIVDKRPRYRLDLLRKWMGIKGDE